MQHVTAKGMHIPSIGAGTWLLSGAECRHAVATALDLGYRHIDTAQAYENEAEVGQALGSSGVPREEVFLTSKVWYTKLGYEQVKESTEESLRQLGTEYIDLMLVHWPNTDHPLDRTLGALVELQTAGKVRHIGVSNFPPPLLAEACDQAPIACNQVEYHAFLAQTAVLEMAKRYDLVVGAYSPLARGRVFDDETLRSIGEKYGKSAGQVALRWLVQQPHVVALPKATTTAHLRENLDIFDFELTAPEMATIFGLARGERLISPPWAPAWT